MIQALIGLILLTGPTAEMKVMVGGQQVGDAWLTDKLTPGGGKKTQTKMALIYNNQKATVIEEVEYAADASPVRKYLRKDGPDGQQMRIATFSSGAAHVTDESGGQRKTSEVPVPKGADVRAASEFWFFKTQPARGATCNHYRFDMDKLAWVETKVKYVGPAQMVSGGKKYTTHLITIEGLGKAWLTDEGKPLRVEVGKLQLIRKP